MRLWDDLTAFSTPISSSFRPFAPLQPSQKSGEEVMQITRKAMSSIPENGAGAKKNKIVNRVVVKEARAYRIGHSYDVRDLTAKYQLVLQLAINLIWKNISWEPI